VTQGPKTSWIRLLGYLSLIGMPRSADGQTTTESAAGSGGLSVQFSGPVSCGPPERLLEKTQALLANSPSTPPVVVEATVSQTARQRFSLHLRLSGAVTGERELSASNCDEALQAGAVVIAWAIDPDAVSRTQHDVSAAPSPEPDPEPAPSTSERTEVDLPAALASSDDYEDDHAHYETSGERFALSPFVLVAGQTHSGLTPRLGIGGHVEVGVKSRWLEASAYGYYTPSIDATEPVAGSVRWNDRGGGVRLCFPLLAGQSLGLHWCAGGKLTWLEARAAQLRDATVQRARLVSIETHARGSLRLFSPLAIVASVGLGVPTTQPRFIVEAQAGADRVVFEPRIGFDGAVGARIDF